STAAQALGLQGRQMFESLFLGKDARCSESVFTGEQLIELQSETVEGSLPPIVVRYDEGEIVHQVGRVLKEEPPLFERLHDKADIALLQVTHATVRQLRA